MRRNIPLLTSEILMRLTVDCESGRCFWIDATKHHINLNGKEAGSIRKFREGKYYWVIKINGKSYRRAQIVLAIASGYWPSETVDHINHDSLDDRAINLRHATAMQNAWNHSKRSKASTLPMGVRYMRDSNKYQARIACNRKVHSLGTFSTPELAHKAYLEKRQHLFGEFA